MKTENDSVATNNKKDTISGLIKGLIDDTENALFKNELKRIISQYCKSSFLNIDVTEKEIGNIDFDIGLKIEKDEDIELYTEYIDRIQSNRDRMLSLLNLSDSDCLFFDLSYDYLHKLWTSRFSKATSQDKRDSEADIILHFFVKERAKRKLLHDKIKRVAYNLNEKMEAISKKIYIYNQVYRIVEVNNAAYSEEAGSGIRSRIKNNRIKINKIKEQKKANIINWH
ncbi:MAG: hypothetical protein Q7R95_02025 [bacterium]|nr:hypothetical protein [bacterium]